MTLSDLASVVPLVGIATGKEVARLTPPSRRAYNRCASVLGKYLRGSMSPGALVTFDS
jgi:hypothetical protein